MMRGLLCIAAYALADQKLVRRAGLRGRAAPVRGCSARAMSSFMQIYAVVDAVFRVLSYF